MPIPIPILKLIRIPIHIPIYANIDPDSDSDAGPDPDSDLFSEPYWRGLLLQVKKPNLDDAFAGAFMAGAAFVAPKKKCHEPLIKFVGKRTHQKQHQTEHQVSVRRGVEGGGMGVGGGRRVMGCSMWGRV